jgi:hypothetical protein
MFDDELMQKHMTQVGYLRLRQFVYQASWSSKEVEHLVFLEVDRRAYLGCDFGLRNPSVERFASTAIVTYGHPNYAAARAKDETAILCSMRFSFGRIDHFTRKSWPRVRVSDVTGIELAQLVADFVSDHILPTVKHLTTLDRLFKLLIADVEPYPWLAVNRAIRAAQIVAIGCQLGVDKKSIRQFIAPHDHLIAQDLHGGDTHDNETCVDRYVGNLMSAWHDRPRENDN